MRAFKIRVWDVTYNEWYYTVPGKPEEHNVLDTYYFENVYQDEKDYIWEQYTGLKDKNGKEIYEGDIIKMPEWYTKSNTEIVHYYKAGFYPFQEGCMDCLSPIGEEVEVIGNIHENKELLEVK